mgnify:CR=1 FL=1
MKHYMRVCAEINLDAVAYNFKSMKDNLTPGTKMGGCCEDRWLWAWCGADRSDGGGI